MYFESPKNCSIQRRETKKPFTLTVNFTVFENNSVFDYNKVYGKTFRASTTNKIYLTKSYFLMVYAFYRILI